MTTAYPTLRLKLTTPTALKLQFLPAVPGFNASQVANKVDRAGDTMQGQLLLAADPTFALEAATKQYVDAHSGGGAAPVDAEYVTSTASVPLTSERVLTDTATVIWDRTTPSQIKATIADDAVTYAKIQNVSAASRLLGRGSASGAGDPQEITLGTNLTMSGTTLNATGGGGTGNVTYTASSTAPVSPAAGDLWYDLSTGVLSIYVNDGSSSQWVMVAPPGGGSTSDPTLPQGRLTLQTLTPVMTTTQSAKTTIFYTPYVGNKVPIYDGTNMVMTTFAELSVATTDTTKSPAAIGASKVNDWFVWSDAGTVRIGHGPDWTSDTVRSAGTALVMVNGILLNNASITNGPAASRGTYVGTTRSNASSQLDWIFGATAAGGTAAFLNVYNAYNRTPVTTSVKDNTATWTDATFVMKPLNAAGVGSGLNNRISWVDGLQQSFMQAMIGCYITMPPGGGYVALGLNSTTVESIGAAVGNAGTSTICAEAIAPQLGFNFVQGLQAASSGTATFYGTGAGTQTCALFALIEM